MMTPGTELKGQQFGVRFVMRGERDPHICIQLLVEDDENWFEVSESFSSFWIDDLIAQLAGAKVLLQSTAHEDSTGFGWSFRDNTKAER